MAADATRKRAESAPPRTTPPMARRGRQRSFQTVMNELPTPKAYYPHAERNSFLTPLRAEQLQNELTAILVAPLYYVDPWGRLIIVPVGFKTDWASLPALARFASLVALAAQFAARFFPAFYALEGAALVVIFLAEWLENRGTDEIAVVHDYIYGTRCRCRLLADVILFCGMTAKGAWQNALWKRILFFVNVRLFGWVPWMNDGRKNRADKISALPSAQTGV